MKTVNIHRAKAHLSKLIEAVAQGQKIVIARAGNPVAMLVPVHTPKPVRKPGAMKGKIHITPNFDSRLPEELQAAFETR